MTFTFLITHSDNTQSRATVFAADIYEAGKMLKLLYPHLYTYQLLHVSESNCHNQIQCDIIPISQTEEMKPMDRVDLYNYFDWRDYDAKIQYLANMAITENWNYDGKSENYILKNYLKYTFWKLQDEGKVLETDTYILFNTGLFTEFYDPIYVYGELFENPKPDSPKWFFKSFNTEYELGRMGISKYPQRADYFSNPSLLIFDPTFKINVHMPHILGDANNIERIKNIQCGNKRSLIIGEIDRVKKRVAANYQLAIPQYYQDKIQLLLPLCLENDNIPSIALTVEKMDGYYQASTCLTLDMAYNNARLIAKPESTWLTL